MDILHRAKIDTAKSTIGERDQTAMIRRYRTDITKFQAYHELLYTERESCGIQQDLPLLRQEAQNFLHHLHKVLRQELVCLHPQNTRQNNTHGH